MLWIGGSYLGWIFREDISVGNLEEIVSRIEGKWAECVFKKAPKTSDSERGRWLALTCAAGKYDEMRNENWPLSLTSCL